ncbi:MAG: hypothetical protein WBD13_07220, partial [Burkholderiaceae bacterium]
LIAELSGLIRKYKGKFLLTREAKRLMESQGLAGIYPRLFRVGALTFNWGYRDAYPPLRIIQQSFAFTLYLLAQRKNAPMLRDVDYAALFLRAFPAAADEVPESAWSTPDDTVKRCYRTRAIDRFAEFFGLVKLHSAEPGASRRFSIEAANVEVNSLLGHVVQFNSKALAIEPDYTG